jgi:hypothetical protein
LQIQLQVLQFIMLEVEVVLAKVELMALEETEEEVLEVL